MAEYFLRSISDIYHCMHNTLLKRLYIIGKTWLLSSKKPCHAFPQVKCGITAQAYSVELQYQIQPVTGVALFLSIHESDLVRPR